MPVNLLGFLGRASSVPLLAHGTVEKDVVIKIEALRCLEVLKKAC